MARYAAGKSQRALKQIRRWRKHQQLQKAEYALKRLQQQHPKHPGLWYELGRLAEAQGQLARAAQAYQRALYFQPRLAEAHFRLGMVADQQGELKTSLEALSQFLQLRPDTSSPRVYQHLAQAFSQLKQEATAIQFYLKALETGKADPLTYFMLAQTLDQLGDIDLAVDCLITLGKYYPTRLDLLSLLMGYLLERQGEYQMALQCYEEAVRRQPHQFLWRLKKELAYPLIPENMAEIEAARQRMVTALQLALKRLLHQPIRLHRSQFFYLTMLHTNAVYTAYHHYSQKEIRTLLALLTEAVVSKPPAFEQQLPTDTTHSPLVEKPVDKAVDNPLSAPTAGRIRLGLMMASKSLALCYVYAGAMAEQLSPERFEVVVCSLSPEIEGLFKPENRFHFVKDHVSHLQLSDNLYTATEQLRAAKLDIMFYTEPSWDLAQYMLATFRVAPVQFTFWMNPGTTGLKQMDHYVSCEQIERPEAQQDYSEKLHKWPIFPSWVPPFEFPEPQPRAEFGLQDDWHLYLCMQNLLKFHPDFDDLIAGILRKDPQGHIIMLSSRGQRLAEKMTQRFQRKMPELMERIWIFPELSNSHFLNLIQVGDVMLDPLYYGGGTTTYQGLSWGVPIVTLPTERMVGRITAALCQFLGYHEGVVDSPQAYIDTAVALAHDPARRQRIQAHLRQHKHKIFKDPLVIDCFSQFLESIYQPPQ